MRNRNHATAAERDRKLSSPPADSDAAFVVAVTVTLLLLTSIPYGFEAVLARGRTNFLVGHSVSDYTTYLTYMQLASHGAWRDMHLYDNGGHAGIMLHPLYIVLARGGAALGLPMPWAFHAGRILLAAGFVPVVWYFIRLTVVPRRTQRLALLLVCFASGLGWLPCWYPPHWPIDLWQPEAITFLCVLLYPHFIAALMLQVGVYAFLLQAERSGRWQNALSAGLCGFGLTLVHTYNIFSVAATVMLYVVTRCLRPPDNGGRSHAGRACRHGFIVGALAAPGLAYMVLQYRADPTFSAHAVVRLHTPPLTNIVFGYGLLTVLAIIGGWAINPWRGASRPAATWLKDESATVLLLSWVSANLLVIYVPFPWQRKLLEGEHIPVAILAAVGATVLLQWRGWWRPTVQVGGAEVALTALLSLSLFSFVGHDVQGYVRNWLDGNRIYLEPGELQALDWVTAHATPRATIQPVPWVEALHGQYGMRDITLALYSPALTGRPVYCASWGETPDFHARLDDLLTMFRHGTDPGRRIALLRRARIDYVIFSQKAEPDLIADTYAPEFRGLKPVPSYLRLVYHNAEADIYAVRLKSAATSDFKPQR